MSGQEPTRRLFLEAAAGSLAGVLSSVHRAAAQRPDRPLGKGDIPASVPEKVTDKPPGKPRPKLKISLALSAKGRGKKKAAG